MISDIPRYFTGVAEWLACVLVIVFWRKRFKLIPTLAIMLGFLVVQVLFQTFAGMLPLEFWILGMAIAVAIMFCFIFLTLKIKFIAALTFCVEAFIVAEFVAAIEWQAYVMMVEALGLPDVPVSHWCAFIIMYAAFFTAYYFIEKSVTKKRKSESITIKDMISVITIAVLVFVISNLSFLIDKEQLEEPDIMLWVFYVRSLVNLTGVILLFTHRVTRYSLQADKEVLALNSILQSQYKQYLQSKENVDSINQKYHDLKHQILVIQRESDQTLRNSHITELENDIKHITGLTNTGNTVLDTIIASKNYECLKYQIDFTSVVKGEVLSFVKVADLCSIFGNILDNAIECAKNISDPEKRVIKLTVYNQNDFVLISCENYFESQLQFENKSLVSTKRDGNIHGFGIKSVKYIAERYEGDVLIDTNNNWFKICILLPITTDQNK